jgi:hypothetical protein
MIVIAVIAVLATGGAYRLLKQESTPTVPPDFVPSQTGKPVTPSVGHGNFQNRFRPTMPLASDAEK